MAVRHPSITPTLAMPPAGPVAVTLAPDGQPPLTFSDGSGPDGSGVEWLLETLDGWDQPEVDVPILPRFGIDGAWIGTGFYRARLLTLRGWIVGNDLAAAQNGSSRLLAACNLVRSSALLTVHEALPTQTEVRLAKSVRLERSMAGGRVVRFEVPLIAADPRRYSTTEESKTFNTSSSSVAAGGLEFDVDFDFDFGGGSSITGGTEIIVGGTIPTYPKIRFRGPSTRPTITLVTTGETWIWTGSLLAGEYLDVDFNDASVLLGGVESRYYLVDPASDWWMLRPGRNVVSYAAQGTGVGDVTVAWRSAWL